MRPATAIHHLFKGKKVKAWAGRDEGTDKIDGGDWRPYRAETVATPTFPGIRLRAQRVDGGEMIAERIGHDIHEALPQVGTIPEPQPDKDASERTTRGLTNSPMIAATHKEGTGERAKWRKNHGPLKSGWSGC